jgi:uncharacterized DUF497 family protein
VVKWDEFEPADFEYDFERDKLAAHGVTFEEAVETFFSDFVIRRNKGERDHHRLANMRKTKQAPAASRKKATPRVVTRRASRPTQEEIDERVIAQAEDDSAWEPPVQVSRNPAAIGLPGNLAQRAAFLARLHRERDLQTWIERVIRERVELEERAFTQARRDLAAKPRRLTSR